MKMKTNKTSQLIYRQGDVLIQRIGSLPEDRKKLDRENGRVVLAHGEVTGHHHSLVDAEVDLYSSPADVGVTFLEVREAMVALTHQEHETINLPTGVYKVTRQRQYSPEAIRNVQD
jgi:hypothetical protein